jgi:hypothetical protein
MVPQLLEEKPKWKYFNTFHTARFGGKAYQYAMLKGRLFADGNKLLKLTLVRYFGGLNLDSYGISDDKIHFQVFRGSPKREGPIIAGVIQIGPQFLIDQVL